ncbi:hypothetical protein OO013_07380 [Mangrovivirga sp. M17]|uniref:Outer membrane protein beta-barrel domain-containing protein n=1 Tax=Mangrovivirga halotolerans TaxID=2993936 RepID=A0ABT3RR64_9BACT|nr:hypothetical protein [Mangrovivirga halotolerans]MCX2743680.1 hypothetical protein [Mangrovivirga halotolerans]
MSKFLSLISVFILFAFSTSAQDTTNTKSVEKKEKLFMITGGPIAYRGDLGNGYDQFRFNFSAAYHSLNNKTLHFAFNIMAGSISGGSYSTSAAIDDTNTYFKSSIISIYPEINWWFIDRDQWKGGLGAGIGIIRFDPEDADGNRLLDIPQTRNQNETYGNISAVIPLTFTIQYYPYDYLGITAAAGFLNPTTDYLDNISERGTENLTDNILFFRAGIVIKK